ncbi:MAG: hypothetical protein FRX49_03959 [Trebouxia sp. A1-2]|nr:MAG: hypothetical protein FRX49_03959 [Trebouxia sp. A1-2]
MAALPQTSHSFDSTGSLAYRAASAPAGYLDLCANEPVLSKLWEVGGNAAIVDCFSGDLPWDASCINLVESAKAEGAARLHGRTSPFAMGPGRSSRQAAGLGEVRHWPDSSLARWWRCSHRCGLAKLLVRRRAWEREAANVTHLLRRD